MRRIPLLPTLVVAAAVAVMDGLGIWQLHRAEWKEGLIARIEAAGTTRATLSCDIDAKPEVRAGRNVAGESGYRYLVPCTSATPVTRLDIGWSKRPDLLPTVDFAGNVTGVYAAGGAASDRILVLEQPIAPLERSGLPSAADLPNNHRFYAAQWFFFAFAAVLIYVLALRRRRR